jgi:shikimate kinase
MPRLWLIGMMGAGKTEVGRLVAEQLGVTFVDTDAAVAAAAGVTIAELWDRDGEDAFRDLETSQLAAAAECEGVVVATGGGAVVRPENVAMLRSSGTVVWLDAPAAVLERRVAGEAGRPLLDGGDAGSRLAEISEERQDLYAAAAHHRIATETKSPEDVAGEVIARWNAS